MKQSMVIGGIVVLIIIVVAGAYFATNGFKLGGTNYGNSSTTTQSTVLITTPITAATTTQITVSPTTTANQSPSTFLVNVAYNSTVGNYLVNATGWTLYLYTVDAPNSGASSCYGQCATYWPPFYASNLTVSSGLSASSFGTINRTGGTKQTTYNGWPLYYYIGDNKAGQVNGQGSGGNWYVLKPSNTTNYSIDSG